VSKSIPLRSLFILSILVLVGPAAAWGQNSYLDEPGIPAFTTSFPVEHGFINLANGSLHIEIPIATYPQRGNIKALQPRLVYDSRFWTYDGNADDSPNGWQPNGVSGFPQPFGVGWRFITGGESGEPSYNSQLLLQCTYNNQSMYKTKLSKYLYQERNGTVHRFPDIILWQLNVNCGPTANGTASALASDNSGFRMDVTNFVVSAVYAPDGTKVYPAVQDTNGNYFTETVQQVPNVGYIDHVADTLGREPVVVSFSGSPGNQVFLDYLNPTGTRSRVTVTTAPINLATSFGNGGDYTGTLSAVQSISFPDGSSYQFQYDSYGQITGMSLPTGSQVTYGYTNTTAPNQINRWLTSRTLDGNTWTFTPSFVSCTAPCTPLQVTVTTPPYNDGATTASDNHVYSFFFASPNGGGGAWPTQIQYFRGAASGTPVLTLTKEYNNGQNNSCQLPMGNALTPVLIRETLTWPSGSGTLSKKAEYCYDTNGVNLITKKMWDYQPNGGFAAAPDREIDNVYKTDPAYIDANILLLLNSSTQKNSGGTQVAQTTYGYNESSLQPSGVTTHHVTPATRANLTSVSRWLNTTGGSVISTTTYYDTGEIYQSKDPLLNATTYTYDSTGAYPSQICNAKNQCSYFAYDFNTGLLTTFTDPNGSALGDSAHTATYSYDSMLRRLCATFPDGGQTCAGYPDPNHVTKQAKITSGLTDSSETVFDDLGRVSETQHTLPNGVSKVDTTYDAVGAVATVTNPYFTASDPTYGVIQSFHDALGRTVETIKQDGSISSVSYSVSNSGVKGLCVTSTDEAGKQRMACSDGFGRVIEVHEPGTNFAGSQASGTIGISGTLQSQSGVGAYGSSTATAQVSISGTDQSKTILVPPRCPRPPQPCDQTSETYYNNGKFYITINGHEYDYWYGSSGNAADYAISVASGLVTAIQGDSARVVNASVPSGGTTITLTAIAVGSAGNNISFTTGSTWDTTNFSATAFTASPASANLSGGVDAYAGITVYDQGTVTVSVGSGFSASASYSQSGNSTATQIASALVNDPNTGLNRAGSPVQASLNDATTIKITYGSVGTAGNVAVTTNVQSTQTQWTFSPPSFSGSNTTLSGGHDPEGPSLDFNYFVTQYQYDALSNLLRVDQKGSAPGDSTQWRTRLFSYDSLSRLLTATNPESGTICYGVWVSGQCVNGYDANGNLLTKTSPAPNQTGSATQTLSYCYDALNRVTGKAYSAQTCTNGQLPSGTAVVSYSYDSGANNIGHLTSLTDQAGSGSYNYDNMGRIASESRIIAGKSKSMSYTYNLDGSVKTLTHPSTAVVTYTPWNNGTNAVSWASDAKDAGNGINYATGATYGTDGGLTGFVSGNAGSFAGITNSFSYNKRLQPINMAASSPSQTVFSIGYDFHLGNGDNGNVWGITNNKDTTRNQTFNYDALNRLTSAQNAGTDCSLKTLNSNQTKFWGNSYNYDAWGNLLQKAVTKCSAETLSVTAFANNQLSGYGYDAAGNMTSDPTDGISSATYDAENRIATATKNGVTTAYTYDAEGNRVEKSNGSTGTLYWYMSPGIVAESDLNGNLQSEYVFFDGQRVARKDLPGGAVSYYFSDHLKTASVITDSSGNIKEDEDYYPWGGELQFVNNDSNHYKFTGEERDAETQLDYFGARYYSNGLGRFISADWSATPVPVPYADLTDPQTLNLYGYVRGLPTTKADIDGHGFWNKLGNALSSDGCWCDDADLAKHRDEVEKQRQKELADWRWQWIDSPWAKQWAKEHGGVTPAEAMNSMFFAAAGVQAGFGYGPEPTPSAPSAEEEGAAELQAYEEGGGHHIPAKSAFRGATGYDPDTAPSIPNAELQRLGVSHTNITTAQMELYKSFSQTGSKLTWQAVEKIETQALVRSGMSRSMAQQTVQAAITALKDSGVSGPTRIPWGK
jgi:RHS repeat-associated protein